MERAGAELRQPLSENACGGAADTRKVDRRHQRVEPRPPARRSAVPIRAKRPSIASASMPRSRRSPIDSAPVRLPQAAARPSTSSCRWANTGTGASAPQEHLDLRA